MYRIRLGCAAYARMNIAPDQARRMMYIVGRTKVSPSYPELTLGKESHNEIFNREFFIV